MARSDKEFLVGETMRREAANVEEAVEFAQQLKSEGRFDWFRGQVQVVGWPPHSSLRRVHTDGDKTKIAKVQRRIEMFARWAQREPDLKYLLEPGHAHDFFAIIQHYGIPTHYIDFTTDPAVAGFFAADTANPPTGKLSCIYCLNTEDLKYVRGISKGLGRRPTSIELVAIDVRNLWRLQAQQGTFVYADYDWDVDYPLDTIVFPYSGYPRYPNRERIYPNDKSPLEDALDRCFSLQNQMFYIEESAQWVKEAQECGDSASLDFLEDWPSGYYPRAFVDSASMVPLESWRREALNNWEIDPVENFFETMGPTLRLKLKPTTDREELRRMVSFGVNKILRYEPGVRSKAVKWDFTDLPGHVSSGRLNDLFRPAWNGMRRLPYSDEEIGDALGSIVALLFTGGRFSECLGDSIRVMFSYRDGSSSCGHVSQRSLANALRPDMVNLLSLDHHKRLDDFGELFAIIWNPSLMFDFELFKTVFAREVIPAQIMEGRGQTADADKAASPVLFNPAHLITFGKA